MGHRVRSGRRRLGRTFRGRTTRPQPPNGPRRSAVLGRRGEPPRVQGRGEFSRKRLLRGVDLTIVSLLDVDRWDATQGAVQLLIHGSTVSRPRHRFRGQVRTALARFAAYGGVSSDGQGGRCHRICRRFRPARGSGPPPRRSSRRRVLGRQALRQRFQGARSKPARTVSADDDQEVSALDLLLCADGQALDRAADGCGD